MSTDPFSDVLRLTEAKAVVAGRISTGDGEWSIRFPPPQRIKFTAIVRGSCWLRVDGRKKPVRLEEGDVFLLPGRNGFVISSNLTLPPTDFAYLPSVTQRAPVVREDSTECVAFAGLVTLHPTSGALLSDVIPALIHVRAGSPSRSSASTARRSPVRRPRARSSRS